MCCFGQKGSEKRTGQKTLNWILLNSKKYKQFKALLCIVGYSDFEIFTNQYASCDFGMALKIEDQFTKKYF
jgi:hypothetical protein